MINRALESVELAHVGRQQSRTVSTPSLLRNIDEKPFSKEERRKSYNDMDSLYTSTVISNISPGRVTSNHNGPIKPSLSITQETIDKLREVELEDVLMNAKSIIEPDPTANMSFCTRPVKLLEGSFKHLVSVKEIHSKTGAFKHRTIEIQRNPDEELGFSLRQGDGWEKDDGIYISRVNLGSVFDTYELMGVGDELVKINKVEIKSMNVDDVIRLMHIPERLSITIKVLTPFSKKRIEKSTIASQNQVPRKPQYDQTDNNRKNESNYKIANLVIGSISERSHDKAKKAKDSIAVREQNQSSKENQSATSTQQQSLNKSSILSTRSPYRTGATNRQLSPIREISSDSKLNATSNGVSAPRQHPRRNSVTWSDQRL